jgi:hypothetical protein
MLSMTPVRLTKTIFFLAIVFMLDNLSKLVR